MAIGTFLSRECVTLEYINMGYNPCLTWCTPVLSTNAYVFVFLVKVLRPDVWLALVMTVVLVSVSVGVISVASQERRTSNVVFNLVVSIFAAPRPINPRTTPLRAAVVAWLWACLVLRIAYEAEMKVCPLNLRVYF